MSSSELTFEALLECRRPSMVALSPGGERLAFVVTSSTHPLGEPPHHELWAGTVDGEVGPLSGPSAAGTLPSWSHDGQRLAFAAERDGDLVPWVREPSGEARPVGDLKGAAEALLWSADDTWLLVLAADAGSVGGNLNGWKTIDGDGPGPDPAVRRPGDAWRRLYRVDLESGETTEVSAQGLNVWQVGWNGSGEAVAIVSPGSSESDYYDASVALLDLDARSHRIVHDAEWQLQSPVISPDGRRVAFLEGWSSDRAPAGLGALTVLELDTGERRALAPELHVQRVRWLADGSLFYAGQSGIETMCGRVLLDGTTAPIWQGPATLGHVQNHNVAISDDGRILAAPKEAPGEPPEVVVLDAGAGDADWRALTDLNGALRALAVPRAERFTWQSDGVEIEGILVTPADRGDERLPVIVQCNGGPTCAWTLSYSNGVALTGAPLANRGYAVLFPNVRGCSGRGRAFAELNLGQHGPMEVADAVAGIEALHEAGIVDRDRAGVIGLSAGGYVAAYAATASRAFKAAVPVACVSNWLSFHLTSCIGRFDEIMLQSDPYDPDGNHLRLSPVMHARGASTPTLILHGALDACTPLGQAQELYQALVEAGVETELVTYRHAGHGWSEREYLLDTWARVSEWFDRHLAP